MIRLIIFLYIRLRVALEYRCVTSPIKFVVFVCDFQSGGFGLKRDFSQQIEKIKKKKREKMKKEKWGENKIFSFILENDGKSKMGICIF